MTFARTVISAAALCVALGATGAYASDEPVSAIGCYHLGKQAKQALDANANSTNIESAKNQEVMGREACLSGYYELGMNHFRKAMELLASN